MESDRAIAFFLALSVITIGSRASAQGPPGPGGDPPSTWEILAPLGNQQITHTSGVGCSGTAPNPEPPATGIPYKLEIGQANARPGWPELVETAESASTGTTWSVTIPKPVSRNWAFGMGHVRLLVGGNMVDDVTIQFVAP